MVYLHINSQFKHWVLTRPAFRTDSELIEKYSQLHASSSGCNIELFPVEPCIKEISYTLWSDLYLDIKRIKAIIRIIKLIGD